MVEVFSDSNWAGCVSRKSTTSTCVFVGGNLVLSSCKRQMSVALSSCEAELLAASSSVAETTQVTSLVKFCMRDEDRKNNEKVFNNTLRGQFKCKSFDVAQRMWKAQTLRYKILVVAKHGETAVGFHKQGWNKEQPRRHKHETTKSQQETVLDESFRHVEWRREGRDSGRVRG